MNDNGNALPASEEPPYEVKHPYAEFKMMPIRMDLIMDQRKLPILLAECANSSMPIEVRRVRIHKSATAPVDLGALPPLTASGKTPGPRAQSPPGMAASPQGRGQPIVGQIVGQADSQDVTPNEMPIDIQGIIYIYDPPNEKKLGTGSEAEKGKEQESQGEKGVAASAAGTPAASAEPSKEPAGTPAASAEPSKEPAGAPATSAEPSKEPAGAPATSAEPSTEPAGAPATSAEPSTEPAGNMATPADAAKTKDSGPAATAPVKSGDGQ